MISPGRVSRKIQALEEHTSSRREDTSNIPVLGGLQEKIRLFKSNENVNTHEIPCKQTCLGSVQYGGGVGSVVKWTRHAINSTIKQY